MVTLNMVVPIILAFIISCGHNTLILGSAEINQREIQNQDPSDANDPSSYRLPDYVLPEKYELWIYQQLAIENFIYEGRVKINFRVFRETNSLVVHVVGLEIDREKSEVCTIVNGTNVNIPIIKQELDTKSQMYIVSLVENIPPGRYILSLSFIGEVRNDLDGFYRSSYKSAGKRRWLGVTQFSSIFARKAFPCLDEPYMKATYRLHIGHYENETVTGNTLAERVQEIKPGYFLTTLAITPPMSTYLVGWAIHDFTYVGLNSTGFGLWTRESMKNHGSRVLNESIKIYDALNKWIAVKNPVMKMEHVAVPDFYWSAMENWGMVTFRESVVLWEDGVTPTLKIHSGLSTIAHEYAHTWFGNLVTPKFWNVAWLKEGFATFFGHYGVGIVHDDWRMMDLFGVQILQPALLQDSIQHNRTMNGKGIGSPKSIPACMDFVTYKKGSSIIRMVYFLVGDLAFHRGLQSYVTTLANKYAIPADFYEHLQRFADQENRLEKPIQLSDVVESWANQPGYPLVTVTRNYSSNVTEISQEKFYLNKSKQSEVLDDSRWWIPVNFDTAESGSKDISNNAMIWIRPQDKSILVPTVRPADTIICNIHQAYYYRVNYDPENWQRLISHLRSFNFKTVGSVNRASLLDDSFNLARAGYIDYSIPLELSTYLTQETDYEPWVAATTSFDFLNVMLSGLPDLKRALQVHVNRVIQPIYENLTFYDNSSDQMRTRLLRNLILPTACSMDNVDCLNTANDFFKNWIANNENKINPDSKSTVYCAGIRSASPKDWHKVLQIFLETELHNEQELLIAGLGCTNNSTLVRKFLNYSLYDGPEIRKQYRLTLFDAVLGGNPENVEHALNFVGENLKKIVDTRDASFLSKIFEAIAKRIVLDGQLQKLIILVESNVELLGSIIEDARKAIEFAEDNISWIRTYAPRIAQWLI